MTVTTTYRLKSGDTEMEVSVRAPDFGRADLAEHLNEALLNGLPVFFLSETFQVVDKRMDATMDCEHDWAPVPSGIYLNVRAICRLCGERQLKPRETPCEHRWMPALGSEETCTRCGKTQCGVCGVEHP